MLRYFTQEKLGDKWKKNSPLSHPFKMTTLLEKKETKVTRIVQGFAAHSSFSFQKFLSKNSISKNSSINVNPVISVNPY